MRIIISGRRVSLTTLPHLILFIITLCSCSLVLHRGMYHETFHQAYADELDGWMEQQVAPRLLIGDYHWKSGKRTVIIWRSIDGYVPTVLAYRVYDNDNDFRDYGGFEGYFNPVCDAW